MDRIDCRKRQKNIFCRQQRTNGSRRAASRHNAFQLQHSATRYSVFRRMPQHRQTRYFPADKRHKRQMLQRLRQHKGRVIRHLRNMRGGSGRKNAGTGPYRELRVQRMRQYSFINAPGIHKQRFANRRIRVFGLEPDEHNVFGHDVRATACRRLRWRNTTGEAKKRR